ncbi:6549_t:CDS:2, partial [Acaulospora colombiana]
MKMVLFKPLIVYDHLGKTQYSRKTTSERVNKERQRQTTTADKRRHAFESPSGRQEVSHKKTRQEIVEDLSDSSPQQAPRASEATANERPMPLNMSAITL